MLSSVIPVDGLLAASDVTAWLAFGLNIVKVLIGFSFIIFFHELGHFLAAKWVGVRVDRFAVGFGTRLVGWRKGEGLTFGNRPEYRGEELTRRGYGETDYCFKLLPIGGYVKMLGQEDIIIDDETGDMRLSDDPRAFTSRPVGQRMIVVCAGVVFNLILAALLLAAVFLHGKQVVAPVVGPIPGNNALYGLLKPGDEVLAVDGRSVHSMQDIMMASVLADADQVGLTIVRDGKKLDHDIVVPTEYEPAIDLRLLRLPPEYTMRRAVDARPVDGLPAMKKGDVITQIDGKPVSTIVDVDTAFAESQGRTLKLIVDRTDPKDPKAAPKPVECYARAALTVAPVDSPLERGDISNTKDNLHILGLRRFQRVDEVIADTPAEEAGFKSGDVILEIGAATNPTYKELTTVITENGGVPLKVVVERDGERVSLTVTPTRGLAMFEESTPKIGISFDNYWAADEPRVADIVPDTPAAELNMPRGSMILAVDGKPVGNWNDVVEALFPAAGRTVTVRYRTGADEVEGRMHVPGSVINELNLPPNARIWSIAGLAKLVVPTEDGRTFEYDSMTRWGVRKMLEAHVGQTVKIEYGEAPDSPVKTADFAVRADNTDPWQMGILFVYPGMRHEPLMRTLKANGNPITAVAMGVEEVQRWLFQVYTFVRGLVSQRNVKIEHVSGPVGIMDVAVAQAKAGIIELAYFMAFLSVNLAVINFMPVPVMDGGLMVFLLIEKIKGKPLSLKTQMISTFVGLAAIILIGLFVTFHDIGRLFQ